MINWILTAIFFNHSKYQKESYEMYFSTWLIIGLHWWDSLGFWHGFMSLLVSHKDQERFVVFINTLSW